MYQTIQVSSCVSVQGEFVEMLSDGRMVIRAGSALYRGRPVARRVAAEAVSSPVNGAARDSCAAAN